MHWLPVRPFSSQGKSGQELLDLVIFLRKKIKLDGSGQTWYQMKGMVETLKKSSINMGSRTHRLPVRPFSSRESEKVRK